MQTTYSRISDLLEPVDSETLVITPNQRSSRFLHAEFNLIQKASAKRAWKTLPCFSLSAWVKSMWQELQGRAVSASMRMLITPAEEELLWLSIVKQSDLPLLNLAGAAQDACKARRILLDWCLLSEAGVPATRELYSEEFLGWCLQYESLCDTRLLIDVKRAMECIRLNIEKGRFDLAQRIIFYAFDEINPSQKALISALSSCGASIEYAGIETHSETARAQFNDETAEFYAAAQWAAKAVENGKRVAIVVPHLNASRQNAERVFNKVFEPQMLFSNLSRHAPGFNISAAQSLSETPAVHIGLQVLKLTRPEIDLEDLSQVLHSPFVGSVADARMRAKLEPHLREHFLNLSPQQLLAYADEFYEKLNDSPSSFSQQTDAGSRARFLFNTGLRLILSRLEKVPATQYPSEWAKIFNQQLLDVAWPGERQLNTLEYQQVARFIELLDSLSRLDYVLGSITHSHALGCLHELAKRTEFHAQTLASPVQLLGSMEAAGLQFDAMWMAGLDNKRWPPAPSANPFIPLTVQLQHSTPHSSADREREVCRHLTHTLKHSAPQVIFSHASTIALDTHVLPSPLIENLPMVDEQTHTSLALDYQQIIAEKGSLETFQDEQGPPVNNVAEIRGGTQILQAQAACPFKAFARYRLQARKPLTKQMGLHPIVKGNLIHEALDHFWRQVKNQDTLTSMDSDQIKKILSRSLYFQLEAYPSIGARALAIEVRRALALLNAWIDIEKERRPFTVLKRESKKTLTLKGLNFHLRQDRVDQLEDGTLLIIDYKTGKADIKAWAGERPDEPQIPMYCIADSQNLSGAAFGQIHVDEVAIKGISVFGGDVALTHPTQLKRIELPKDWSEILQHWRDHLDALAAEFVSGYASVSPKRGSTTCRHCDLQSVCRVRELQSLSLGENETEGEARFD